MDSTRNHGRGLSLSPRCKPGTAASDAAPWVIEHTIAIRPALRAGRATGDGDAMRASFPGRAPMDDPLGPNALDFWVGRWMVSWAGGGHGTNTVRRILDDRVIEESFDGHEGDSSFRVAVCRFVTSRMAVGVRHGSIRAGRTWTSLGSRSKAASASSVRSRGTE